MTRRSAAALVLLSLGLAGLAGCGGESVSESTTTAASTAVATAPTGPLGDESLPPQDAVPGVEQGETRTLATAKELVDVLYQSGDPAKPAAQARLEAGGYAGGELRDQQGSDSATGLALLRSYALSMRDDAAARDEVTAAVDEVRSSSAASATDIDVSGIPDAQAVRVEVDQGGLSGTVVFVTFPAGPAVYGIQGVSTDGADMPEDEIIGAARALAQRVGATP